MLDFYRYFKRMISVFRSDPVSRLKKEGLVVGSHFQILDDVIIDRHHCWHITIGNHVTLAPRVHILAHDASTKRFLNYTKIGKVSIGDYVFIGASAIILPGVCIGSNVIIGAGSVVVGDIPNDVVAAGNPAKIVCTIDEFVKRRKKEMGDNVVFGREYSYSNGVSREMKGKMNDDMSSGIGYIV